MKNENEPTIDQAQHERLCAYVFGELTGAERDAFEAELFHSPVLQAEHARLTATIGLVKRAVPDEGLPAEVRRELFASVRRSRFRFLRGRRLMTVAAAALALVSAAFALRYATRSSGPFVTSPAGDVQVAQVERLSKAVDEKESPRGKVRRLDAAPVASPSVAPPKEGAVLDGFAPAPAAEGKVEAALEAAGGAVPEESGNYLAFGIKDKLEDSAEQDLDALGYGDDAAESAVAAEPQATGATVVGSVGHAGHGSTGTPSALASRRAGTGGGGGGQRVERSAKARSGFNPLDLPASSSTGPGAPAAPGLYRGPGDSAPPGGGENDPSAAKAPASEDLGRLRGLGYVGEDAPADGEDRDALGWYSAFAIPSQDASGAHRVPITPEEVDAQATQLLAARRLRPGETPSAMFFRTFGDSPFLPTREERISTFSVDVDTASYALTRSYLERGQLPPRAAVRTEEFVNYFKADQPPPTGGEPFALGLELAPSPFAQDARTELLRVTVRGKDVEKVARQPVALTFVVDNSGSMEEGGRLELVKRALALLLGELGSGDSVALVKFSNEASVVSPLVSATRRAELEGLIRALPIEGGTNVEAGLRLGYELAVQNLARNAVNRVILCSDGVGNIGETSANGLLALVAEARAKGVYLNTVGVGMGNHNDAFLEELADKGDGVCNYVDSDAEAKRVFVDGLAKALQPIARDVKIQVEFDAGQVESWRLLGYENRALRTQDFQNDKIDAGEVNAGHQVTALYELVRNSTGTGPLATARLRYKPPFAIDRGDEGSRAKAAAETAREIERVLSATSALPGFAAASPGFQRSALVAQFAEVLRQSVHARGDSFGVLLEEARRLARTAGDPDVNEFVALLERANPLLDAQAKQETPKLQVLLDEVARLQYEQALRERRHELALQAGEEKKAGEREDEERVEREARETIQRLEAEVRAELRRQNGIDPDVQEDLQDLGYGKDK